MKTINEIINESIKISLREEIENIESIDNKTVDLISLLHNSQKMLRELHWNTRTYATHLVTDKAIDNVLDWEDKLAEVFIGNSDKELLINETKPSEKDFVKILNEISDMASALKEQISGKNEYDRLCAVIDEILESCSQMLYLGQMK